MRLMDPVWMTLPKISVIGAGNVGATTAQLLLERGLANVVLIDIADGLARGKALDLLHMKAAEGFAPRVFGSGEYADAKDSDIVIVTAGVPRKPGMTREDLLTVNAGIVRSVLDGCLAVAPNALYLLVTNPLDIMVNLAFGYAGLGPARLFGMGGVLDSARFAHYIAARCGCEPTDVEALVIGAHGEAMLPLPRLAKVAGAPLAERLSAADIAAVVKDTVNGGAAVVEMLQTGSAFYAPAASIAAMVSEVLCPSGKVLSVCARLQGEYGIGGINLGVPVRLGSEGIREIVQLELEDTELQALRQAAAATKEQLAQLA